MAVSCGTESGKVVDSEKMPLVTLPCKQPLTKIQELRSLIELRSIPDLISFPL